MRHGKDVFLDNQQNRPFFEFGIRTMSESRSPVESTYLYYQIPVELNTVFVSEYQYIKYRLTVHKTEPKLVRYITVQWYLERKILLKHVPTTDYGCSKNNEKRSLRKSWSVTYRKLHRPWDSTCILKR